MKKRLCCILSHWKLGRKASFFIICHFCVIQRRKKLSTVCENCFLPQEFRTWVHITQVRSLVCYLFISNLLSASISYWLNKQWPRYPYIITTSRPIPTREPINIPFILLTVEASCHKNIANCLQCTILDSQHTKLKTTGKKSILSLEHSGQFTLFIVFL